MFKVKSVNENEGVTLALVDSIEEGRRVGCAAYASGTIDERDIVQIWDEEDDSTAAEEFGSDEC